MTFIGKRVERVEDLPLVTGRGQYVANLSFPGELHMRVVRSAHAHGELKSLDASSALEVPGVVAVWAAKDVQDVPPIEFRPTRVQGLEPYRQPILATGVVRYVGEPVAVVFAENSRLAEDAAERVIVDVSPLPPRMDAQTSDVEPAVLRKEYGDVDGALESADVLVSLELSIGRHSGVPLECRGALARVNPDSGVLELHGATKRPHANRDLIARMLRLDPARVHLFEGHVGGGFGVRGELYPEDLLVCLAAMRLNRPVKWIEDRRENLLACNQSREQRHRVTAAVDRTGCILGLHDEFFHDQGAYVRTHGARVPDMTAGMLPGMYRVPAYRAVARYRLTNKTPAATYRAPGRFEATFVMERVMDAIARRLSIDRVEVRRRNLISKDEMPLTRPLQVLETELVLDSGDYAGLLKKAQEAFGWDRVRQDVATRRASGESIGTGLALFVEKSGLGPTDLATIELLEDGRIEVVTGAGSLGQGIETVMAQICADAIGVDYKSIRVVHGRTDRIRKGFGSHASRTTVMTGAATHHAALALRARILDAVEGRYDLPTEILEIRNGDVVRTDVREKVTTLAELAKTARLEAEGEFNSSHMTYPYGAHLAVVSVDRETGAVRVLRYFVAYDIGRAINPMLVEGQICGGVAQGIGGALYEEFVYDETGQPLSVTLADYLMPTAREVPLIEVLITEDAPSPLNPLGVKGAGEAGINAVGAAIASAIDDALGGDVFISRLPVTPVQLRRELNCKVGTS
jgi:CO/xanthine dehydrogenase Mo-binding subunit